MPPMNDRVETEIKMLPRNQNYPQGKLNRYLQNMKLYSTKYKMLMKEIKDKWPKNT
jgi:hypothetical protein